MGKHSDANTERVRSRVAARRLAGRRGVGRLADGAHRRSRSHGAPAHRRALRRDRARDDPAARPASTSCSSARARGSRGASRRARRGVARRRATARWRRGARRRRVGAAKAGARLASFGEHAHGLARRARPQVGRRPASTSFFVAMRASSPAGHRDPRGEPRRRDARGGRGRSRARSKGHVDAGRRALRRADGHPRCAARTAPLDAQALAHLHFSVAPAASPFEALAERMLRRRCVRRVRRARVPRRARRRARAPPRCRPPCAGSTALGRAAAPSARTPRAARTPSSSRARTRRARARPRKRLAFAARPASPTPSRTTPFEAAARRSTARQTRHFPRHFACALPEEGTPRTNDGRPVIFQIRPSNFHQIIEH